MPTVAAYGAGVAISITAIDAADSARYYILNSTDNGTTFSTPQLLSSSATNYNAIGAASSSSPLFFGDYNRSVRTQCQVYSTWADGRNNLGSKVYYSKANYCALGVNEITSVTSDVQLLSLFPNPASGQVNLQFKANKGQPVTIMLTDMTGKIINKQHNVLMNGLQQIDLPLTNIAAGNYVVSVQNNEGIVATRVLVVQ